MHVISDLERGHDRGERERKTPERDWSLFLELPFFHYAKTYSPQSGGIVISAPIGRFVGSAMSL